MMNHAQIAALEAELRRQIDEFADHDWGEHDVRPWIIWHVLSVASGAAAIDWLKNLDNLPHPCSPLAIVVL